VDVEGAELRVLKGASETIEPSHPSIIMELNEMTSERDAEELHRIVRDSG
jgi:hypothetical protein